jgi:hypothetical protein
MYNYLYTLAYVTILNTFYVILALFISYHIWIKKLGGIPISINLY